MTKLESIKAKIRMFFLRRKCQKNGHLFKAIKKSGHYVGVSSCKVCGISFNDWNKTK